MPRRAGQKKSMYRWWRADGRGNRLRAWRRVIPRCTGPSELAVSRGAGFEHDAEAVAAVPRMTTDRPAGRGTAAGPFLAPALTRRPSTSTGVPARRWENPSRTGPSLDTVMVPV